VASTIIGATSLPQLRENLGAWGHGGALPEGALEGIEAVYKRFRDPAKA
jgi:aryl-alcohol dehydrogenase-like predicted oxidoreductase